MKIGLVGNQNSGKTTLFNDLTGMNAKIGNWPGVTIEKKMGIIKGTEHEIIDLPGIYSLSPYTTEEDISRQFIFEEKPDIIINIIDATSLERSLYLTTQLLELDCRVIVALNMADLLEKRGWKIDENKLAEKLGTKVIKISALKEMGIDELIEVINEEFSIKKQKIYNQSLENCILNIEQKLNQNLQHKRFISIKLLEKDGRFYNYKTNEISIIIGNEEQNYGTDLEEIIATERYTYIEKIKKEVAQKTKISETLSDKLDKIFLNKWLALPIFAMIMFLVYYLSVGIVGSYTVDWIAGIIESFGEFMSAKLDTVGVSEWLNSLVVDGIIAGVGAVLTFVPQLILLFMCIAILETTGYMSRIALFLDKIFRKIGLSGKSLIPFIIGVGCSVPGIMGARIIENEDETKMTTILTPFIPCSAKLPIIALFTGYFFPENPGIASASLYFFAIAVIILSALVMKKFVFKNISSTYISELPEYKLPKFKYVIKDVFDKIIAFIQRAGTVILICSIVIWFLVSFSFNMEYGIDVENSILADVGNTISWIFKPMLGEDSWGATVSAIQGLVAKEQVISSMAVISGLAEDTEEGNKIFAKDGIFAFFTASSAYAFMVFNLFSAPCFGAIGAMKRELGGTKRMLKAVMFQTILAWILAVIVYQVGYRIEMGLLNIANIIIISIILTIVILIIFSKMKNKDGECASCPYYSSCDKK